jgi:hypothetical protein
MVAEEQGICLLSIKYLEPTGSPSAMWASTIAFSMSFFRSLNSCGLFGLLSMENASFLYPLCHGPAAIVSLSMIVL